MPKNRIIPAVGVAALLPLAAWAQGPSAPPPGSVQAAQAKVDQVKAEAEAPTEAETAIDAAIGKTAALKSVAADLTETVDMLDQRFTVNGRYLRAPGYRMRLQLQVAGLPGADARMLQVCDGQTLWDYQQVLDSQVIGKLVIAQILEKLKAPELDDAVRDAIRSRFGFAGPDELLRGLRAAVKFDQKAADTLDGKPAWKLTGEWKSREGLTGPNQQALPAIGWLPAYVPSLVTVWVGQEDGWPYKVRLVGRRPPAAIDTRKKGPDGQRIGALSSIPDVKPTAIEIIYSGVKINPDLSAEDFAFTPPQTAKVEDRTALAVASLDQLIQFRAAAKKAEAAKGVEPPKGEEPVLKQPIELPRPSDTTPAAPPGGTR